MKRTATILLSFTLAIYVLAGTVGINVYKQTCLLFGKTEYSLFTKDNCCGTSEKKSGEAKWQDGFKCCHHSSFYAKADFDTFEKFELPSLLLLPISSTLFQNTPSPTDAPTILGFADSSPPLLYGKELVYFVGQLIL